MDESLWDRVHRLMERLSESMEESPAKPTDDRDLAERFRRELRRYDEHRDQLSPPERERLLEFVVDDLVGLSRVYGAPPPAAPPRALEEDRANAALAFQLLVDAGGVLAGSLEYEAAIDRVARLAARWFCNLCVVHLTAGGDGIRRLAAVHRDPEGQALVAGVAFAPADLSHPHHPVAAVLRGGKPLQLVEMTPDDLARVAADERERVALVALDIGGELVVPLPARSRVLGTITFARTRGGLPFTPSEVQLAEELARRAALAVEDARLRDDVERARRAQSEFVGSISHEFRTPLMTVVSFAHLLQEGIPVPIPDAARDHVERIVTAAGHLDRLVEESLGYRRVEGGWETVQPRPVDLAELARETAALVAPLARQKGLDLDLEVGAEPFPAETDADKVRQILLNLLGNAVKFTDLGGIRLVLRPDGDNARFEVWDTGIGIAHGNVERVFEPFWQAEPGAAERGPGIGLGLALVRRFTWMLGGDIRVESEPGRGSVFRVTIPRGRAATSG
ncbi:MAG TPA: GAF domain-containing sensor histidine kinase [Longimicrobium sp.]